jgi:hypothetical protein
VLACFLRHQRHRNRRELLIWRPQILAEHHIFGPMRLPL